MTDNRTLNLGRATSKAKFRELNSLERRRARTAIRRIARKVGGFEKLSSLLGARNPGQTRLWIYRQVPLARVAAMEQLTRKLGLGYDRTDFRPDVFPVQAPRQPDGAMKGITGVVDYYD